MLPGWRRVFRLPSDREQIAKEVDDEIAFHIRMRAEALRRRGLSEHEAEQQAMVRFGNRDAVRQECQDIDEERERSARRTEYLDELRQDLRYVFRMIARRPGFAAVIVSTLAIGIGATTAMFAAVNGVLLRPLPYDEAERVVTLWQYDRKEQAEKDVAPANYLDWKARATSFEHFAAAEPYGHTWTSPSGPEALQLWLVTEEFFAVLGTRPSLGRTFRPEEFQPGRERVAVVSHEFWRTSLNADPALVGKPIVLDNQTWLLIGVMPEGYVFPDAQQIWAPKIFTEEERQRRGSTYYMVIGRLKPDITIDAARAELSTISEQLGREYPRTNANVGVVLIPLPDRVLGDVRGGLFILLGAVAFLLLIACANVTNLLLADASRRGKEFAVRVALGARSGRIVRQLLTESLLLSIAGGVAGLLLARLTLDAIRVLAPVTFPRMSEVSIDPVVLAFAFGISTLTALIVGLVPARRAARSAPGHGLVAATRSATSGRAGRRLRGGLVVSEMALACVLLVGAGLLIRSFVSLLRVERGYRTENVVALTLHAWDHYPTADARIAYVREVTARLETVPGIAAAAATSSLPLSSSIGTERATFEVVGEPIPEGAQRPSAHATATTPGYFGVMGMSLRAGRLFAPTDDARSTPVVLINESLARQYFPNENPIGRRMQVGFASAPVIREIVGIVGDVRHQGLHEDPRPGLFVPHAQRPTGSLTFIAHTALPSASLLRQAEEAVQSVNASLPISRVTTIESLLAESLRTRRFQLWLLGAFSFTALVLAAIGIYGVISYTTRERTRELGLRMALGARAGDVLRLVLRDGTALALLGVVIGIAGAAALTRLLSRMLFNVTPLDPAAFGIGATLLFVVAVVACYLPARRAARLDPVSALREE